MQRLRATLISLLLLTATATLAAGPHVINFQGILRDGVGNPVANGSYSAVFSIYDAPTGGSVLWTETQSVTTSSGLFSILLGGITPVPDTVFYDSSRYLGIKVAADPEMTPRQKLSSVGYSYVSSQWTSGGQDLVRSNGNVGIGTAPDPKRKLDVSTSGPVVTLIEGVHGVAENTAGGGAIGGNFEGRSNGTGSCYGVYGKASDGTGDHFGILGRGYGGYGAAGYGEVNGLYGEGFGNIGVYGRGDYAGGKFEGSLYGAFALGSSYGGIGTATADGGAGLIGGNSGNIFCYGVYSSGDARVTRNLTVDGDCYMNGFIYKTGGGFRIDHPSDPANKYLYHSFVESPDMTNLYNGNITLDGKGEATVELPEWFGALNKDFRYQLTAIGAPGPNLYIAQKVAGNRFRMAGGTPGMEVSWQVTGIRQDAYANAHRIPVELDKPAGERGRYLHPKEQGMPETLAMNYAEAQKMEAVQKDMEAKRTLEQAERAKMAHDLAKMKQDDSDH